MPLKITKLGHCCLIIEVGGARIMTDPGAYSTLQNEAENIDYIFITHEHQDHFHLDSLKIVLKNNLTAVVVTNKSVGKLLDKEGIAYEILEDTQAREFSGILVEVCGEKHAVIYESFGQVQNTGYFFTSRFFYPGDTLYDPGREVEILALPVAGPWVKIGEAIDYAKLIKPKVCFPVHDGMLKFTSSTRGVTEKYLLDAGIKFVDISEGTTHEF